MRDLRASGYRLALLTGDNEHVARALAKDLGLGTEEKNISLEEVFSADEVFSTGTMAEITPITSIDKKVIGKGIVGENTKRIQKEYFCAVHGESQNHSEWLEIVK